jgi:tetratricopeptide (TPR) repeat protein
MVGFVLSTNREADMKLGLLLIALVSATGAVQAADNKSIAKEAFREGTRQYDMGDYAKALDLFKKAYLHYEEPVILFNIAQCERQLGNKPEAVKALSIVLAQGSWRGEPFRSGTADPAT